MRLARGTRRLTGAEMVARVTASPPSPIPDHLTDAFTEFLGLVRSASSGDEKALATIKAIGGQVPIDAQVHLAALLDSLLRQDS